MSVLDIEIENANKLYQFLIAGSGISVTGIMQNELSIAGSNSFSTVKDVMSDIPIVGKALDIKDKMGGMIKLSGRSTITDYESRLVYDSSEKPVFSISYKFLNLSADQAVGKRGALPMAKMLHQGVLPTKGKPAMGRTGLFFKAPLGYTFAGNNGVQGTVSLSIGKWFKASELVVKSTNFTPSKEVMSNGQPLYVTGTIDLEPYELITYATFMGYFR